LREFWVQVTSSAPWAWSRNPFVDLARGEDARNLLNQMSANLAAVLGAAGFFSARPVMPWLQPGGSLGATSFYDTKHLKHTLERLVDFDRLNAGMTRFSAGAVNVRTGNFVYFDTTTHTITPEHVMASGALQTTEFLAGGGMIDSYAGNLQSIRRAVNLKKGVAKLIKPRDRRSVTRDAPDFCNSRRTTTPTSVGTMRARSSENVEAATLVRINLMPSVEIATS
jgi:hypothetical protein